MSAAIINVDVFSDPICPWCFIGKRRLEQAVASYEQPINLATTWRCFQLNPSMPADGMDRLTYLAAKFGGPERAKATYEHIHLKGLESGIEFNFSAIQRTPNTLNAHRLLRWAQVHGQDANALMKELFEAYFLKGRDIGNSEALLDCAANAGLDEAGATLLLQGDDYRQEIEEEEGTARAMGLSGVPLFVFDQQYALSGAQEPQAYHRIFDLLLTAEAA